MRSSSIDWDALELLYTAEEFIDCTLFSKEGKKIYKYFFYTHIRELLARMWNINNCFL